MSLVVRACGCQKGQRFPLALTSRVFAQHKAVSVSVAPVMLSASCLPSVTSCVLG